MRFLWNWFSDTTFYKISVKYDAAQERIEERSIGYSYYS